MSTPKLPNSHSECRAKPSENAIHDTCAHLCRDMFASINTQNFERELNNHLLQCRACQPVKLDSPGQSYFKTQKAPHPTTDVFNLASMVNTNITTWLKWEASKLKRYLEYNISTWTGHAEFVLSDGIEYNNSTITVPFPLHESLLRPDISLDQATDLTRVSQLLAPSPPSQNNGRSC